MRECVDSDGRGDDGTRHSAAGRISSRGSGVFTESAVDSLILVLRGAPPAGHACLTRKFALDRHPCRRRNPRNPRRGSPTRAKMIPAHAGCSRRELFFGWWARPAAAGPPRITIFTPHGASLGGHGYVTRKSRRDADPWNLRRRRNPRTRRRGFPTAGKRTRHMPGTFRASDALQVDFGLPMNSPRPRWTHRRDLNVAKTKTPSRLTGTAFPKNEP